MTTSHLLQSLNPASAWQGCTSVPLSSLYAWITQGDVDRSIPVRQDGGPATLMSLKHLASLPASQHLQMQVCVACLETGYWLTEHRAMSDTCPDIDESCSLVKYSLKGTFEDGCNQPMCMIVGTFLLNHRSSQLPLAPGFSLYFVHQRTCAHSALHRCPLDLGSEDLKDRTANYD